MTASSSSRPTLLLLHGFTGSSRSWDEHLPAFRRDFDAIALDLPGHGGRSEAASVEDTARSLAKLAQGGPVHVLGYSLGARIALRLAIEHPWAVARLVLESPSAGIAGPAEREARRRDDERQAEEIERDGVMAFIDRWERNNIFASHVALPPEAAERQRAIRLAQHPRGLAESLRLAGQGAMEPLHDRLGDVKAPTLVIVGELDPARARGELVGNGIPNARLVIVDGAGHTPHLERPDAFLPLVLDFLKEDPTA